MAIELPKVPVRRLHAGRSRGKVLGTMARPTDATSRTPEQEGSLGGRVPLISIMGFRVLLDPSWFFLALLISWSLASAFFPSRYPGRSPAIYWSMGVAGTIGLLISLIFHELSHSLVARRHGLAIRGITLFIFGGVAEMVDEPASPKAEFAMAIAGPIASLGLAIAFQALMVCPVESGPSLELGLGHF